MSNNEASKVLLGIETKNPITMQEQEALEIAILSLIKQTPKKPAYIDRDNDIFKCPTCGDLMWDEDNIEEHKYCLNCGQALDWTEG